jgi:hypothetical protein
MFDIHALAKKIYNKPLSEIMDDLYKPPSPPPAIKINENTIEFYREVEFRSPQTLDQDSAVKRSQLGAVTNTGNTGGSNNNGSSNNSNSSNDSSSNNNMNLSEADW